MKYEIGQEVWHATFENHQVSVTCPDCGGTGRLRVTFHDETQVSIGCRNCSSGYDKPTGRVEIYEHQPRARLAIITGVEVDGAKVEWRTSDSYRVDESALFDNEADCMASAMTKAAAYDQEQRDRVFKKEKDTRTWAWNASYHRKRIKEAQRDIEYHSANLNVAKVKAKEKEG
jgi:ribosomal protein S27E